MTATSYAVSMTPYLKNDEYLKIITIKPEPTSGALKTITKRIPPAKLSPFTQRINQSNNQRCNNTCLYAVYDINNQSEFMCLSQMPELYNYLIDNGYTINDSFTKLILKTLPTDNNSQLLFYCRGS